MGGDRNRVISLIKILIIIIINIITLSMPPSWRVLYVLFILVRFTCVLLPGYIHPDEFFQGQELFFGRVQTWEWNKLNAARSIVPSLIMSWLPIQISSLSTARMLWIVPRLWMTCLSFILDAVCWNLTFGNRKTMLLLASAWPTLLFMTRPWTNSLETIITSLLLLLANFESSSNSKGWSQNNNLLVGSLGAIGFWTRFTTAFYALPLCVSQLWQTKSFLYTILSLATGFVITACSFVYADVVYYHGEFAWKHVPNTITPINIFLYNMDIKGNLAQHGLHFQGLHALVNIPMLFGIMGIWFYWDCWYGITRDKLTGLCRWTIASGIFFLSCSPHQEPRFLLPCLVPFCILASRMPVAPWVISLWIGSNALLGIFWGVLHQGQVSQSLLSLQTMDGTPVLYWRTYMPPTFLAQTCSHETTVCTNIDIIDVKDRSSDALLTLLNNLLNCDSSSNESSVIQLVTPTLSESYTNLEFSSGGCHIPFYQCSLIQSHWPHVSTEDFPQWQGSLTHVWNELQLGVYSIKCLDVSLTAMESNIF
jgi:GPI mannosyltransferase 4